jgi:hypothetical protein
MPHFNLQNVQNLTFHSMKKHPLSLALPLFLLFLAQTLVAQQPDIQYYRPWNKDGINIFEPSKKADQPAYTGFKLRIGGSFTQDYQSLKHSNTPTYVPLTVGTKKVNGNLLYGVVAAQDSTSATLSGFNTAMANLNFDIQIEDGIRVCLENYMSTRHHNEFWVKGGYIQIDKLPFFGNPDWYSKYLRVKIGHFQPNFGDMTFRRTDAGNAIYNPFVENLIMDAFTTEIGGELYVFPVDGFMGMIGMNSGLINGNIENYPTTAVAPAEATKRTPSIYLKLAYDKKFSDDFRFRLSASWYNNPSISRNTLYGGDRAGSHYFMAGEPAYQSTGVASAAINQETSARFSPGMANKISTISINPFIKFKGLEIFGSYEALSGRNYITAAATSDRDDRKFSQMCAEGLYRLGAKENVYVGVRYIKVTGRPQNTAAITYTKDISVDRTAIAAGWFPTKNMLLKAEYLLGQNYTDFPTNDYRNNLKINGFMVEAVIGF